MVKENDNMFNELEISKDVIELVNRCEEECKEEFKKIDERAFQNSLKVLSSFHKNRINESHFNSTTGYGYNDLGREAIEEVFKDVLGAEDALVRNQFVSGSHALAVCFFALLRPGDVLLSVCGKPYDTMDEVIGIKENASSLMSFGVKYDQIELVNDDFDYDKIRDYITNNKVKVVEIQRSKGYSTRKSLTIDQVEKVIKFIRNIDNEVIIMIDNCYCEFVSKKEPTEVGADIAVGSLIKNLGGGIAQNGAYIVGRRDLVELAGERLNVPGQGKEVGPLNQNRNILQGLYFAPSVVASSVKTAILTSLVMEKLGYKVEPKYNDERADIVELITFGDADKLVKYVRGIQKGSAIDSDALVEPSEMPGYEDPIVMASGSFVQGSSIELSCDGPLRAPYVAYQQGGLTYEYGKLGLIKALEYLLKE